MAHYAQVTEADLKEAARKTILNDAEKEVQNQVHNPVQNTPEPPRKNSHETQDEPVTSPCNCESKQEFAAACESVQNANQWAIQDSNLWPPACKAGALAN